MPANSQTFYQVPGRFGGVDYHAAHELLEVELDDNGKPEEYAFSSGSRVHFFAAEEVVKCQFDHDPR